MNKKRKGFTLTELVIVIAVIGILAGVLIPVFSGVVFSANLSADGQDARSLTMQLKLMESEDDLTEAKLYEAIHSVFGDVDFSPRTAGDGYHYWYDVDTNEVLVKKEEEITTEQLSLADGDFEPYSNKNSIWANSLRFFFDRYYLIDEQGSALADVINDIYDIDDEKFLKVSNTLTEMVADANSDDKKAVAELNQKLQNNVLQSENDAWRLPNDNAQSQGIIYVCDNPTTIYASVKTIVDGEIQIVDPVYTQDIVLPGSIEKIQTGALNFVDEDKKIVTEKTESELENLFSADATNGTIVSVDKVEYVINVTVIVNKETGDEVGNLSYSNEVASFEYDLSPTILATDAKLLGNVLYVAYGKEVTLVLDNFKTSYGSSDVQSNAVTWVSLDENNVTVDGGRVTVVGVEQTTITVSADVGTATYEIEVIPVYIDYGYMTLGGVNIDIDNTNEHDDVNLVYDASTKDFSFADVDLIYNPEDHLGILCDESVSVSYKDGVDNGLFTIADDYSKISLVTYAGEQTITVSVANISFDVKVVVVDNSATPFEKVFKYTDKYVYILGNSNAVALNKLFTSQKPYDKIGLKIVDASTGNNISENNTSAFYATYEKSFDSDGWGANTVKFGGTGVAIIYIGNEDLTTYEKLVVEIVNGRNVTASDSLSGGNVVMIEDRTGSAVSIGANTLYGNGFSINAQTHTDSANNELISVSGGHIDNVIINGPTYPEIEWNTSKTVYFVNGVELSGNGTITNSYISGFRSPVRVYNGAKVLIDNTVLEGGIYANLDVVGVEHLTLRDLTTIQTARYTTVGERKQVLGAGIVFESAEDGLTIEGKLTQYNWVKEEDKTFLPSDFQVAFGNVFTKSEYAQYRHTIYGVQHVNAGIVFLAERNSEVIDNREDKATVPYAKNTFTVKAMGMSATGSIFSYTNANGNATDVLPTDAYSPAQCDVKPVFVGADISYKLYSGDTNVEIDLSNGVSIQKYGIYYDYTVTTSIVGKTVSDKKIYVDYANGGSHTVTYTVIDNIFYDVNGNATNGKETTYTFTVNLGLEKDISAATFAFDSGNGDRVATLGTFFDTDYKKALYLDALTISDNGTTYTGSQAYLNGDLTIVVSGLTVYKKDSSNRYYLVATTKTDCKDGKKCSLLKHNTTHAAVTTTVEFTYKSEISGKTTKQSFSITFDGDTSEIKESNLT